MATVSLTLSAPAPVARADELADMAARLRRHPDYGAAAWRHAREYAAWRDGLGSLNKVIANLARLRVLENLVYLHYLAPEPKDRQGASFERLAEISGAADEVGVRAVRTVLRLADTAGLVLTGANPADGRQPIYRPTVALLRHCREALTIFLRPLEALYPHLDIGARLATDEGHRVLVLGLARAYHAIGVDRLRRRGEFEDILRLEGATAIFCVVIDCFRSGLPLPSAPALSRRFFLSQSQVRAVLKAAEDAGLIETAARGRLIDAEPLALAFDESHRHVLAFAALHLFDFNAEAATVTKPANGAGR